MVALLLSAVAIMPVFGATTGTVAVSKTYVSPTGEATITVDDADLNTLTAASQTLDGTTWTALETEAFTLTLDTASGDEISGTPTVTVTASAGSKAKTNFNLSVFNTSTGQITIQAFEADTATLTIDYNLAKVGTTSVDVTSPSDETGVTVELTESGADTGVFEAIVGVSATASVDGTIGNRHAILAVSGQAIDVKYSDADPSGTRATSFSIEDTEPAGVLVTPADKSFTTSLTPTLTVDFTDSDSLIDAGTIAFAIYAATNSAGGDLTGTIEIGTVTTTDITNGYRATVDLASVPDDQTMHIIWNASATDAAGNTGTTDNFKLFVDNAMPDFANATASAGAFWDATALAPNTDTEDAITTSIAIQMPAILDIAGTDHDKDEVLDASTVVAADFEVDDLKQLDGTSVSDVTPTAANVYAGYENWIFLTVPAMAPDAKPKVNLLTSSSGIADTAGNKTSTTDETSVTSSDKQAPTVTTSLDKTLDDEKVTLTITTNEAGGTPTVNVQNAGGAETPTVSLTATNTYEAEIEPSTAGLQAVKVTVSDANGNSVIKGSTAVDDEWPGSSDIAFYVDTAIPAPTVEVNQTSASGASVETSSPFFITADFSAEGAEYGLDATSAITVTAATVADDLDVNAVVTIATATLDDVDILSKADTQDNATFTFPILDIATGDHELVIVGTDEAGNEVSTGTLKFTVTARKAYKVAMNAGWNLISFPGDPTDGAIGTVLPAAHPATDVLSFDDGVWSVASRAAGGTWEGTLTALDGKHGYWINTSTSEPVEALLTLPSVGSAATLPTIAVEAGWNLVSVIDLAQTKQPSTAVTGDAYFTSIDWAVAYTYSSSTRAWTRVTSSTAANLTNGQGIWVWANKAGTLIP